jgi:hypothetical protein
MRASPSIVPSIDRQVYLVVDDFGKMGCAWRLQEFRVDVQGRRDQRAIVCGFMSGMSFICSDAQIVELSALS